MSSVSTNDTRPWGIFLVFLRLGLTSFGGPVAHLGYFREAFVVRRQWLTERSYADLVALCQFLPGPASSQVGMALGLSRGGYAGAFAAWAGFTLPSALALIVLALGIAQQGDALPAGLLQGLKVVAVAVVAQAVWGMARTLCPDRTRVTLMAAAAALTLLLPSAGWQVLMLALGALAGLWWCRAAGDAMQDTLPVPLSRRAGAAWLGLFLLLLLALPVAAQWLAHPAMALVDMFYRAGSLVFGGGHVVLPLLQAELVPSGWVDADRFLAGYGATQAVPGPLFTFAAFLGASTLQGPSGWVGGILALLAIFLPSFLLVAGALPFWAVLRRHAHAQAALAGVNAAVVGLLLAALYHPVWTGAIHQPRDVVAAWLGFVALVFWKAPPWLVVAGSALAGALWLAP